MKNTGGKRKVKLTITKDYEDMSQTTAQFIIKTMQEYPEGLYCFAGGDTPVRTLQLLCDAHQRGEVDLQKAYYVELDEWVGLDQENPGSCLSYLNQNLFKPTHIPFDHIHVFDSQSEDLDEQCKLANEYIDSHGGLTLTLLGVGQNGHLGFNEPGVSVDHNAHIIELDNTTKTVGQKYFHTDEVLSQGITLGLRQLMASRIVVVEANGKKKQAPIQRVLQGEVDVMCPVTIINTHPQAYLIIDQEAANREE